MELEVQHHSKKLLFDLIQILFLLINNNKNIFILIKMNVM